VIGGPVGTSSDIASKSGFFASLFVFNWELKRFLRYNDRGIWIKIHLNPNQNFGCINENNVAGDSTKCLKLTSIVSHLRTLLKRTDKGAGPSGFEPETAGFLSKIVVKSPVLYLAELRALR
jgi:hypothetical protein